VPRRIDLRGGVRVTLHQPPDILASAAAYLCNALRTGICCDDRGIVGNVDPVQDALFYILRGSARRGVDVTGQKHVNVCYV